MKNDLVTIVVPMFNSSKTIKRCVNSILSQTYNPIEIILIDDGSSDETLAMVSSLYGNVTNLKIVKETNMGVSHARNIGIDKSNGKYIVFVDSDDYVSKEFIEKMVDISKKSDADIVVAEYYRYSDGRVMSYKFLNHEDDYLYKEQEIGNLLISCIESRCYGNSKGITNLGVPWSKLYKKDTIGSVRFDEQLTNMEDMIFNLSVFDNAYKVYYLTKPLYYYTYNTNSLVNKHNPDYKKMAERIVSILNNFCANKHDNLVEPIRYKKFCLFYECIKEGALNAESISYKKLIKEIKTLSKEVYLTGRIDCIIAKYCTKPQLIYGMLLKIKAYHVLGAILLLSERIKRLNKS